MWKKTRRSADASPEERYSGGNVRAGCGSERSSIVGKEVRLEEGVACSIDLLA
jgi:hypothetical protein